MSGATVSQERVDVVSGGVPFFIAALLFAASVIASLFFNGMHPEYFALAMSLLLVWLAVLCWRGIAAGRPLPGGRLLLALGLYTGWLLLTLLWNPVPYLGVNYFWLLATPLLVVVAWYWVPGPERLWNYTWPMLLLLGVGLMLYSLYQYYWLGEMPHAFFVNRNSFAALVNLLLLIAVSRVVVAQGRRSLLAALLIGVVLSAVVIGLGASRGAFLGLVCAVLVLIVWSFQCQGDIRKRIWLSIVAIGMGVALANLPFINVQNRVLSERVGGLSDPYSAGSDRFLIWEQSVNMALAKPVSGYGLGTYWQHWPQWRDPADRSGGFWAHSDPLHLWVEAGLPAVLLLLAVHCVLLGLLWRVLRSDTVEAVRKTELAALFAGLLAVAVHALFDFNYYTLPIVLVLSLMMARIARIERDASVVVGVTSPRWLRLLISSSVLGAVIYFATIGSSVLIYERAVGKMNHGELEEAEQDFVLAQRLWGQTDIFPYSHAALKLKQLANTSADDVASRKKIFLEAQQLLDRSLANGPLRPIPYFIRGQLLVTAAELAGDDWLPKAEAAFKQSLVRDPRYLDARLTLARILEVTGRQVEADALLEQGMPYFYFSDDPNLLTFYQMVFAARNRAGDEAGAVEVMERHNEIVRGMLEAQRVEQEASKH